ncbi:MAG: T9SS type A sorting domain-containing protein [Bacteroidetes bacterium]|nr:T9SS type A sorting domain-containing protein [Bacteroidota bacterium]
MYTYVPALGNTIQWLLVGGQIIANNDSLTVQWDSTSTAKVGLIERNALGCASDTVWLNVEVDLAISVEEQTVSNFKLSPNPASQQITLERSIATVTESLVIVDAEGRPVMNTKFEAGKHKLSLNIDHLPAGIYYVKGQSNRTSKAKFSIVRH